MTLVTSGIALIVLGAASFLLIPLNVAYIRFMLGLLGKRWVPSQRSVRAWCAVPALSLLSIGGALVAIGLLRAP